MEAVKTWSQKHRQKAISQDQGIVTDEKTM